MDIKIWRHRKKKGHGKKRNKEKVTEGKGTREGERKREEERKWREERKRRAGKGVVWEERNHRTITEVDQHRLLITNTRRGREGGAEGAVRSDGKAVRGPTCLSGQAASQGRPGVGHGGQPGGKQNDSGEISANSRQNKAIFPKILCHQYYPMYGFFFFRL